MPDLLPYLRDALPMLPNDFREANHRLWDDEFLKRLADRLADWHLNGVPTERPLPHFSAEITPDFDSAFAPFRPALAAPSASAFTTALRTADTPNLLILLGMRWTSASLTGPDGIPPNRSTLMQACETIHNPNDGLTVGARAWSKHVPRSTEAYWGVCRGSVADKNAAARVIVERILNATTWWNVFGHFQHEFVFEARVPTGHGARWGHRGESFIGFLEPFDEELCPSLQEE